MPKEIFGGGENGFSLSYKEENGTSASIVYEGDMLRFTRGITQAAFSLSRITSFSYVTDLGAMPVSAYTERLDVMERDGKLLLTLSYFMHISGMVQKTVMKWKLF